MNEIDTSTSGVRAAFDAARAVRKPKAEEDASSSGDRTIHDTVEISGGTAVNLARGQQLADSIRTEADPEAVAENLGKATNDVFRITRLFTETLKEMFRSGKSA